MKRLHLLLSLTLLSLVVSGQENNTDLMEQKITFITLGVNSLEVSTKFYEKKMGWKRSEMSSGDLVVFDMNGLNLALYPREELAKDATVSADGSGFRGVTFSYNAGSEAEVDSIISTLEQRGVTVVKAPEKVFWGGYSGYISDPDGNLWEIAYNPFL